jgi:hypothetical protein
MWPLGTVMSIKAASNWPKPLTFWVYVAAGVARIIASAIAMPFLSLPRR